MNSTGKIAWITGASSGIGHALALRLSRQGSGSIIMHVGAVLLLLALVTGGSISGAAGADQTVTVVTLGDSYINGYTISDPAHRFSAQVASRLSPDGPHVVFQDIGFKNTSKSAAIWLAGPQGQALVDSPDHHAVILEIGQNDCGSLKLDATRAYIDSILSALASKAIPVLVVGTRAYPWCGTDYAPAFKMMFSDLAAKYGDLLYPDFKSGIEDNLDLLASDHDHPNEAGEAIIAANILPLVDALILRASGKTP